MHFLSFVFRLSLLLSTRYKNIYDAEESFTFLWFVLVLSILPETLNVFFKGLVAHFVFWDFTAK